MHRPPPSAVGRVAVIGTGLIGAAWVTWFLSRGIAVAASDPAPDAPARLRAFIARAWPLVAELGAVADADPDAVDFFADPRDAADGAAFIQENAPDRETVKKALFAVLDSVAPPEVVIASSSSSLLMTPLQKGLRHPERCLLGHPFNPPHLIPLVEVSGGELTAPEALDWAMAFYAAIGKRPVRLNREVTGHIAGRLNAAVFREAAHLVEQGIASVAAIDEAMAFGPGLRLAVSGPTMIYHLGGGAGGLRHFLDHLGDGQEKRWATLGAPRLTPELREKLIAGVEAETAGRSIDDLERERDAALVGILRALKAVRPR